MASKKYNLTQKQLDIIQPTIMNLIEQLMQLEEGKATSVVHTNVKYIIELEKQFDDQIGNRDLIGLCFTLAELRGHFLTNELFFKYLRGDSKAKVFKVPHDYIRAYTTAGLFFKDRPYNGINVTNMITISRPKNHAIAEELYKYAVGKDLPVYELNAYKLRLTQGV